MCRQVNAMSVWLLILYMMFHLKNTLCEAFYLKFNSYVVLMYEVSIGIHIQSFQSGTAAKYDSTM